MLKVDNLIRRTGDFVLHIERLELEKGGYLVLLGPSGSGKTMLLELLAGLENADSGYIFLNGTDILKLQAGQRGIGMVFQKQWLFPHLSVAENIAYGLQGKGLAASEIDKQIKRLAQETRCDHLLKRRADKLSGGEAQRVAIARALAIRPKILLLDEPLANLDAPLRAEFSSLIRQLNRRGQTIIHVTHDYSEAIALATDVAVMHQGRIVQQGSPKEVFSRPNNAFVARFAGIRNFFHGSLSIEDSGDPMMALFSTGNLRILLLRPQTESHIGHVHIAASSITLSTEPMRSSAVNQFKGEVVDVFDTSEGVEVVVEVQGIPFYVVVTRQSVQRFQLHPSANVYIQFKAGAVQFEPDIQ